MSHLKINKLPEFDPPGYPIVDDLTPANKKLWSSQNISDWMQNEITAKNDDGSPLQGPNGIIRTPLTQFFNGTITPYNTLMPPAPITWTAFPNRVSVLYTKSEPLRWQIADASRIFQDEYLELSVDRNGSGNIKSVTFTCEGPEYWEFLAQYQPDTLDKPMRSLNKDFASEFGKDDFYLVDPNPPHTKEYNPNNYWNELTTGTIAHLIHPSNTLSAEIDIAAQSTVIRKDSMGKIITDEKQLNNYSQYGNPDRNSDPHIGGAINAVVRGGASVSIENPVALYMYSFTTSTLMLDIQGTGNNMVPVPDGAFNWQRGDINKHMGLRLKVKIPDGIVGTGPNNKGRQLTVSDIFDTNDNRGNVVYGAQLTDYIQMSVSGVTINGVTPSPPQACPKAGATALSGFNGTATNGSMTNGATTNGHANVFSAFSKSGEPKKKVVRARR